MYVILWNPHNNPMKQVLSFSGGSVVKNRSLMQETQIRSLGLEDLLEKEMATHSSILAWKIPQTEEPGRLQSMGSQRVRHDLVTEQQLEKETESQRHWVKQEKAMSGTESLTTNWADSKACDPECYK